MAIIFQSPKKKQRIFLVLIIGLLMVLLVILVLVAFLPEINNRFKNFPNQDAMSIPEIKINFAVVDSEQTRALQLFTPVEPEFSYIAKNSAGRQVTGKVSAATIQEAAIMLQNMGLSGYVLQEIKIGREDPFTSY